MMGFQYQNTNNNEVKKEKDILDVYKKLGELEAKIDLLLMNLKE